MEIIKDSCKIECQNSDIIIKSTDAKDTNNREIENQYSHCMKNVDFIIYFKDKIIFIEMKNYAILKENELNNININEYFKLYKPINKDSIIYHLLEKCRSSFIKEYSLNKINTKRNIIYYYVILNFNKKMNTKFWNNINSILEKNLPIFKDKKYKKPFIKSCGVITANEWQDRAKNIGAESIKFSFI